MKTVLLHHRYYINPTYFEQLYSLYYLLYTTGEKLEAHSDFFGGHCIQDATGI